MGLKVNRQDNLDAMFGKFAELDLDDEKRDKFLKHDRKDDKKHKNEKRPENKHHGEDYDKK
ncbi:SPJ_0845 family protein [Lentilactobacillus sp. SPB1-3]|uniref:SPJ_0845 family protein n=1 Tax=Lentilactobacillus terminaliae TaxID=3003483 RepID=A0ACD5DDJ7_9LACO|nr:SPJ_0845 family protein [Lentilactobacillus sp. SPB1-3]MCZ0977886.1 SPJ_0845 family protein [Lentilactobacillus sp. SPB1-3]